MAFLAVARAPGEGDHGPVRCKEVGRGRRASRPYAAPAFGRIWGRHLVQGDDAGPEMLQFDKLWPYLRRPCNAGGTTRL